MLVELQWGDGSSSLFDVLFPAGPSYYLRATTRDNEIKSVIDAGRTPTPDMFERETWFYFVGIVGGTPIYRTGEHPRPDVER